MCIICYKPKGASAPSKKTVKTMFSNNPDGAGFMFRDDAGAVIIKKGFMTFGEFYAEYQKLRDVDAPLVMHFRITTDGGTSRGMCHPFPITRDADALTKTECRAAAAVAHNGIISMCRGLKNRSDSAEYARRYLTLISEKIGFTSDALDLIEASIDGSRLAIMTADDVYLLGKWYKDGGLYFSNESYKSKKAKRAKASTSLQTALDAWDYWTNADAPPLECFGDCDNCKNTRICYGY